MENVIRKRATPDPDHPEQRIMRLAFTGYRPQKMPFGFDEADTRCMADLTERAKTDPEAARELEEKTARRREISRNFADRQKQRAAVDPEFATEYEAKQREKQRQHNERQKQQRAELRRKAETDPAAAEELAAERAKQVEAVTRSRRKLNEAALTDPVAAAKREQHLAFRREQYAAQKPSVQQAV